GAIRARVAGRPCPKTLLVFGREPGSLRSIDASGGYGFLHDMLESAGGADAVGDIKRESVRMSAETVLARAPEVIIELRDGAPLAQRYRRGRTVDDGQRNGRTRRDARREDGAARGPGRRAWAAAVEGSHPVTLREREVRAGDGDRCGARGRRRLHPRRICRSV